MLSLRENGMFCHWNKPVTAVIIWGILIHHLIVEIQVAVGFLVRFSWGSYILQKSPQEYVKIIAGRDQSCVWKIFESSLWNESKPGLLSRSCELRSNNFRVFSALTTENQSHFQRSETVKRFIEVSPRRRRPEPCRARSLRMIKRLVAVFLSPLLLINWIYTRPKGDWKTKNATFIVSLTASVYVMDLHDSNGS